MVGGTLQGAVQQAAAFYAIGLWLPECFMRRRAFPLLHRWPRLPAAASGAAWVLLLLAGVALSWYSGPRCGLSTILRCHGEDCMTMRGGALGGWGTGRRLLAVLCEVGSGVLCTYAAVQAVPSAETVFSRAGQRSLQLLLFHANL